MNAWKSLNATYADAKSPSDFDSDSIGSAFHLVTGDSNPLVAVRFAGPVIACDDGTNSINDVLEAHGQIVEFV
jgi:hypothetical protein